MSISEICRLAKSASYELGKADTKQKNKMLELIAEAIESSIKPIIAANVIDTDAAKNTHPPQFIDRLTLNESRIKDIVGGVRQVILLNDPVSVELDSFTTAKGLKVKKISVPLGVVGIIYEARPNVTVDTAALCLKSGNAVVLRGSKDAINTNKAIVSAMKNALKANGFNPDIIQLIEDTSREGAVEFMTCNKYVDVLIPRGSASLINAAINNSTIPVIETGTGNCHVYVEQTADMEIAERVLINAKTSRMSVCNSCESMLIDKAIINMLPHLLDALVSRGVEVRGCPQTCGVFAKAIPATEEDYYEEYLSAIISVKVVNNYCDAIRHINTYGTHHSEAIITQSNEAAEAFKKEVDAAAVYVNASTRFTDGFEFGFGAELGISTQKIHARGPIGLKELTSYKYCIEGDGNIR